MAIAGYDKERFAKTLSQVVSPSQPIQTIEHLIGRQDELKRIERALLTPGRSIFIFGERGVGKSSLAATAANQWQSSDEEYIDISCAPDSTIRSIVGSIASQAVGRRWTSVSSSTSTTNVGFKWLSHSIAKRTEPVDIGEKIRYLGDAIEVLKEVSLLHSKAPVVVIDEVDRIADQKEVDMLADLLKQVGDKKIDIKFIFTGVGRTLDEILGAHRSAIRQLETIELPRLSWDARWNIAKEAMGRFGIEFSEDSIFIRLAAVSDGYPYYVHLIVEKLLWLLFEKDEDVGEVSWADYYAAVDEAIVGISAELARPYEMATHQRTQDYEEVLWATSADEWQGAHVSKMFRRYEQIMSQREGRAPLAQPQFNARIRNLLKPQFGPVLTKGVRQGYYHYKEKMLRGYIRMQAEANRIEIISEEAKATIKNYMHVPAKNVGYHTSTIPRGVKQS